MSIVAFCPRPACGREITLTSEQLRPDVCCPRCGHVIPLREALGRGDGDLTLPPTQAERTTDPAPRPEAHADPGGSVPPVSVPGYEVLGELGRGAMGVVYRARQIAAGRVAMLSAVGLLLELVLYQANVGRDRRDKQLATEEALSEKEQALRLAQSNYQDAQRQYALVAIDRGLALCEDGDTSWGMLFLVAGLRYATESGDVRLQRFLRTSLTAWRRQMVPLRALLPHHGANHDGPLVERRKRYKEPLRGLGVSVDAFAAVGG